MHEFDEIVEADKIKLIELLNRSLPDAEQKCRLYEQQTARIIGNYYPGCIGALLGCTVRPPSADDRAELLKIQRWLYQFGPYERPCYPRPEIEIFHRRVKSLWANIANYLFETKHL
jgi:hypothetical protein